MEEREQEEQEEDEEEEEEKEALSIECFNYFIWLDGH